MSVYQKLGERSIYHKEIEKSAANFYKASLQLLSFSKSYFISIIQPQITYATHCYFLTFSTEIQLELPFRFNIKTNFKYL